ncbi:CBS domain-containing protein [Streptomyces osmaniensis]|uniref:CBS domain-containing protein n=1 Tax=Streptomyces osmaniensis TaxID=593134 RepID=UPI003D1582D0
MSAVDDMAADGPRVSDDMTVEVALSVMVSAGVEYLFLCDGDDQCTGSITLAELAVHRGSSTYTDQIRLRDVLADRLPRSAGSPAPSPFLLPGRASCAVSSPGTRST